MLCGLVRLDSRCLSCVHVVRLSFIHVLMCSYARLCMCSFVNVFMCSLFMCCFVYGVVLCCLLLVDHCSLIIAHCSSFIAHGPVACVGAV